MISQDGPPKATGEFFVSGGTLPLNSQSYIERAADGLLFDGLRAGSYCYVLNSRQMGKSSLSVRTMARLAAAGIRTVFVDLTQVGGRNVTAEQWYAGLSVEIGRSLGLRTEILAYLKEHPNVGAMQRFFGALRHVVLAAFEEPLVLFIDEIDATRNLPFDTDEFFAGIRECFNRRVHDETYRRLTFCLLGVAVPTDLIRNPTTTPFNIGERIQLQDFTAKELQKFASALGSNGEALVRQVHYWTNGQPFLTQSLCQTIVAEQIQNVPDVDRLVDRLFFGPKSRDTNANLADVANRVLNDFGDEDPEQFRADVLSAYERAWKGSYLKDDEANRVAIVLKLAGLMRSDGARLRVRNQIYHHVFDREWIQQNMPGQELLRLQQSYRRGLVRGIAVAAAIVASVATLGIFAWSSRQAALEAKRELDYELYVADMNSLRLFEESGDIARMREVLERTKNSPHRGFEWGFWQGRLHDSAEEYTMDYTAPGKRAAGLLSRDRKQLCLVDTLLGTATIVDRASKKVIATRRIDKAFVISTRRGFVFFDNNPGTNNPTVTDVVTGEVLWRLPSGQERFTETNFSDMSDYLAARHLVRGDPARREFGIWDLTTGKQVYSGGKSAPKESSPIGISRTGTRVLLIDNQSHLILWDTSLDKAVDEFSYDQDGQLTDFSESGRYVIYRDRSYNAYVRDTSKRKVVLKLDWNDSDVPIGITVSPDDTYFVTLFANGRASLRELPSGKPLSVRNNIWALATSSDASVMLGASESIRILKAQSSAGTESIVAGFKANRDDDGYLRVFQDHPLGTTQLSDPDLKVGRRYTMKENLRNLTYNGRWGLGVAKDGTQSLLTSIDGKTPPFQLPRGVVNYSAGKDISRIAVVNDKTVSCLIGRSTKPAWTWQPPIRVAAIWMSPRATGIYVSLDDGTLVVLDPATGNKRGEILAHNLRLTNLTFDREEKHLFTCGYDGRAIMWDAGTLKKIQEFRGNASQRVSGADLSPDGRRLATCNYTGAWQLWDVKTGAQLTDVKASSLPLRSIVFTADGKKLVTAGDDRQVRAWGILDGDPTIRIPVPAEAKKRIAF